ncbi:MAG: hypothetical protein ACTSRI_17405 [Promethearchaeota archaeon]
MWSKEPIENFLDSHFLYRAVHRGLWQNWESPDRIDPIFFYSKNAEEGLSFDWSKYSTPEDTLKGRKGKSLKKNGIIQLNIGKLRTSIVQFELPITIEHNPPENQAHTLMFGITKSNTAKIRRKLSKIVEWAEGMKPQI